MSTNIRYSKEWWKERLPLLQAWTEGKKLQFQDGCDWLDSFETCCFESPLHMYRIAPEPKLRPWKPEEVPVGALLKLKQPTKWRGSIVASSGDRVLVPRGGLQWEDVDKIGCYLHSTDGGRTWAPCGVMEEQQ